MSLQARYNDICPSCGYEDSQIRWCDECDTVICGCCEDQHSHLGAAFDIYDDDYIMVDDEDN